jgi:hypothetical protein
MRLDIDLSRVADYQLRALQAGERLATGKLYVTGDKFLLQVRARNGNSGTLLCDVYKQPCGVLQHYEVEDAQNGVKYSLEGVYRDGSAGGECDVHWVVVFQDDTIPAEAVQTTYHELLTTIEQ